jgi:hypothetical protein
MHYSADETSNTAEQLSPIYRGDTSMSAFKSYRLFAFALPDLTPVAGDIVEHFKGQDYEVTSQKTITNGHDISITKGGIFKTVLGLKTALKISIQPSNGMTKAQAGVGIFGQQAIPTAITLFLFWPVILTQIWGLVQNSKLDEEAMGVIEASLRTHGRESGAATPSGIEPSPTTSGSQPYCTNCGASLPTNSKFCSQCGNKIA